METYQPKHYLKVCVERELTDSEFEDMVTIVDEELGDYVISDDIYEHENENGLMCYVFHLGAHVADSEPGLTALDLISFEIDQVIPDKLHWELDYSA